MLNLKIYIEKFKWSSETELKDINFFSTASKTLIETLDLTPFILEGGLGKLQKTFSSSETVNGTNILVYQSSNITFKLNGLKYYNGIKCYLRDFLLITEDSTYFKFRVKIYNGDVNPDNLLWTGFVYQDSNDYEFSNSGDSDKDIECLCVSYENEFKSYFQQKNLPSGFAGFEYEEHIPEQHRPGSPNPDIIWAGIGIQNLLNSMFTNVEIQIEESISTWRIINKAYIGSGKGITNPNGIFLKQGLDRICDMNTENYYDYLRRLCSSMGWLFYFDKEILYIRNAATNILSLVTLDLNKFESGHLSQSKAGIIFDSVLIPDGYIGGGDGSGLGGSLQEENNFQATTWLLLSDSYNYPRTNKQWEGFVNNELKFTPGYRWCKAVPVGSEHFKIIVFEWTSGGGHGSFSQIIKNTNILNVDGGDTDKYYMGYSTAHNYHFLSEGLTGIQDDEFIFKGNYGSALYRIVNGYMETYCDYIKTSQFKNNFNKFLCQNANRKLKGIYNIPLTDHLVSYNIINGEEFKLNDCEFALNSISTDLEKETTELEIQIKEGEDE